MAEGFRRFCAAKGNDPWRTFLRYQAQAERNYRRALEEFDRLKALRNELPNEPITDSPEPAQPEESTMTSTDQSTPLIEPAVGPPARPARPSLPQTPLLTENPPSSRVTRPDSHPADRHQ